MRYNTLYLGLFCLLFLSACATARYRPGEVLKSDQRIHFGQGGGFTGLSEDYVLLPNGQLFLKYSRDTSYRELTPLPVKDAKAFFSKMEALRLHRYDFNYPGNRHYYLRQVREITDHTVRWGATNFSVRADIEQMHKDLIELTEGRKWAAASPEKGK